MNEEQCIAHKLLGKKFQVRPSHLGLWIISDVAPGARFSSQNALFSAECHTVQLSQVLDVKFLFSFHRHLFVRTLLIF